MTNDHPRGYHDHRRGAGQSVPDEPEQKRTGALAGAAMTTLTMGELFAGIGGFSVGLHRAGFETRWAVEWDRDCRRVLRYHWPDVRIYGDVREFTYKAVPSLQRDETAGLISSAQDRANGAALVVQDLRQPVRTRDAEQAVHARATAAMVVDDALSHDTGRYGGDAGNAEQRMRDLPATNEPSLRRSRSRNWEGARAPLPSVQHQTGGDRGSGFPIGGDGVSAPEFVDIITGGFPCQDLSVAGKRAGLDGERSGLFFEFMRVIREMQEASDGEYPRFAIFENVPGFLSSSGNRDFGIALSEMVGCEVSCPADGWGTCGVVFGPLGQAAWRILDAQYFGVAQRRRRVFIVYDPRGERAGQVLIEPDGLSGHPAPRREAREDVVGTICGGSGERGWAPDTDQMKFVAIQDGSMPRAKKQNGIGIAYDAPMYTLDSYGAHAVAATVSAKWAKGTGGPSGDEVLHLVAHTLTANGADASEDGTGRGTPLVAFNWQSGGDQRLGLSAERGDALGTSQTPAVAFMQNQRDEVRDLGNVAGALPAQPGMKQENYVAQHEVFPTLAANRGRPGSQDWQQHAAATSGTAVRRLTPRECERLQGFEDDWTLVDGMADSPRYRMLGNAVAVPVVEWIGRRIAEVLR